MNKIENHFDVNQIVYVTFVPERPSNYYKWNDSRPIKYFFGLIKTKKFTKAGWGDGYKIVDKEYLINDGYKIVGKDVYHKSKVHVYLTNKHRIDNTFESENDAKNWMEDLKITSGKTFEIV